MVFVVVNGSSQEGLKQGRLFYHDGAHLGMRRRPRTRTGPAWWEGCIAWSDLEKGMGWDGMGWDGIAFWQWPFLCRWIEETGERHEPANRFSSLTHAIAACAATAAAAAHAH